MWQCNWVAIKLRCVVGQRVVKWKQDSLCSYSEWREGEEALLVREGGRKKEGRMLLTGGLCFTLTSYCVRWSLDHLPINLLLTLCPGLNRALAWRWALSSWELLCCPFNCSFPPSVFWSCAAIWLICSPKSTVIALSMTVPPLFGYWRAPSFQQKVSFHL